MNIVRMASEADQRITAITTQCVMCGLCLPHCPSYAVTRVETDSPRGRLALMARIAQGALDQDAYPSLDRCLACGRCERVCPAKVDFVEALVLTRSHHGTTRESTLGRISRWLSQRRFGPHLMIAAIRARRWFPSRLRSRLNLDGLATTLPARATGLTRKRDAAIQVLGGCVGDAMEGRAMAALERIAERLHATLAFERGHCCGALAQHLGKVESVTTTPKARTGVRYLAINSGCLTSWRNRLGEEHVIGIAEWLDTACATLARRFVEASRRIALHIPCTQQATLAEIAALRRLIARLPGAVALELPTQPGCCGAAGTYFLNQPAVAKSLARSIAQQIAALGVDLVVSSNGACRAQLAQTLIDIGARTRVVHPAELIVEYLDSATP